MARPVKCAFCGLASAKETLVRYEQKNFHENCLNDYLKRKELFAYVAKIFKFKSESKPGPKILSQVSSFREKYGYSYEDMLIALQYQYEIVKADIKGANEGIGIVPYVMDEAKEFFKNFEKKQEDIAEKIEKQVTNNDYQSIEVKVKPKKIKRFFDFEKGALKDNEQ